MINRLQYDSVLNVRQSAVPHLAICMFGYHYGNSEKIYFCLKITGTIT